MPDDEEPAVPRHLVAVPEQPGHEIRPREPTGPPVYADIQAGERNPVLPVWLSGRAEFGVAARRLRGKAWHASRYHGLRSPVYLAFTLGFAVWGLALLVKRQVAWWWVAHAIPLEFEAAKNRDGQAWDRIHRRARETRRFRGFVMLAEAAGLVAAGFAAWFYLPGWGLAAAGSAAVLVLARVGRPSGHRIIQPAHVPAAYEALTQDVVLRALGSLGIAAISQAIKEGEWQHRAFPHPVRQDGPGYRADVDLPHGVTATMIIDRREQLASGLRRPLGAVWPEPVTSEHAGRLELWVGMEDISKAKPPPWPLLKAGTADVFRPFPFSTDVRGRRVNAHLAYHNWLIGSIPRQGKTAAVRLLACGVALDPLAELWIAELKGTGDLDALQPVSHRFVSGIDDDSIGYAAESLSMLRAEIEKRSPRIKALDPRLCPEKRVTREIAAKRSLKLWPVVCIVDECQNLFAHEKYGKQAGEDAGFIIKVGPAMGVVLILATQRPDAKSLPTAVRGNVSYRFCLKVMGQEENDMILGTSMYKNGIRATVFRPKIDAGLGYLLGEDPAQVCRTYFLDVPAARSIVARARVARERAGTLSGVAAEQDRNDAPRDVLGDVLAVLGGDAGLHWETLAARLAHEFPDRWAGATGEAMSAQCRDLGVPSVSVRWPSGRLGAVRKGCRRVDVEEAAHRNAAGQPA